MRQTFHIRRKQIMKRLRIPRHRCFTQLLCGIRKLIGGTTKLICRSSRLPECIVEGALQRLTSFDREGILFGEHRCPFREGFCRSFGGAFELFERGANLLVIGLLQIIELGLRLG